MIVFEADYLLMLLLEGNHHLSLFAVFDRAGIQSITDIFENKKLILKFILETKDIDPEVKKMIKDYFLVLFQTSSEVKIEEIKMMFQKVSLKH